jgi:amino-acid N-acetyltransferase
LADVAEMQKLVRPYVEEGIILFRSDDEVANTIRSYTTAREDGEIVGFAALYIYSPSLGEIRSLVVGRGHQKKGIGKKIVGALLDEGRRYGLKRILSLTFEKTFFQCLGFVEVSKEEIPESKVWEDCIKCKLFPVCNESALIIAL